jgi:hypothetical protein
MQIKVLNAEIDAECNANANASFIDSIPGIGPYSALGTASEYLEHSPNLVGG